MKIKKFFIFYVISIIFTITNIILAVCENFHAAYGLEALEGLGRFVIYIIFSILGFLSIVIIGIIQFLANKDKNEKKHT